MTETILPHELPHALDRAPDGVKVLSLDCFDTLLWRDCHAPSDVFAGLSAVSIGQRIVAETRARKAETTLRSKSEVSLAQIYANAMPNACNGQRGAAIAEELALEAATCFAFEPTLALMREAKRRGLKVVIVSDTYLSADELRTLIASAAGEDVAGLIDRLFVSSDAGISKAQGLLARALKSLKCKPGEVLHIGDNKAADYDGARAFGIPALHLDQFSDAAKQRMRFERACQQLAGEARRSVRGLMPHRALLAREEPQVEDRAEALGLTVLGPVFHAFDRWLRREAEQLAKANGGQVHWLFMLRDGHLPHIVHQAGGEAGSTARVEISRFVAIAASLTTREAYSEQFALEFGLNPATLARQMLLDDSEIEALIGDPQSEVEKAAACEKLRAELKTGKRQKLTRRRARARVERLIEHVRRAVDPKTPIEPGDTLMLVDLGYNGSAQDRVDALLAEAFDCHVAGRYLLLREMAATGLDKKGLIDARHYDGEFCEALCGNVAVLEQLATCELGSVVDFTDEGEPIRKQSGLKGAQSDVRDRVQAGVVRFARAACKSPIVRGRDTHSTRGWREAAVGALTRFMFLPVRAELDVLESFEHDVNLGSERMVALFDEAHAREGMRRRGLFYMKGSERMLLPAELAGAGIDTRLSLLAQKRFGLALTHADSVGESLAIPAFFIGADESASRIAHAFPTHEGFYAVRLPLPDDAKALALQVGSVFEWFELGTISMSPISSLAGGAEADRPLSTIEPLFDAACDHGGGLIECTDPAAFVLVNPPHRSDLEAPQMVEITLRPLRRRAALPVPDAAPFQQTKDAAA